MGPHAFTRSHIRVCKTEERRHTRTYAKHTLLRRCEWHRGTAEIILVRDTSCSSCFLSTHSFHLVSLCRNCKASFGFHSLAPQYKTRTQHTPPSSPALLSISHSPSSPCQDTAKTEGQIHHKQTLFNPLASRLPQRRHNSSFKLSVSIMISASLSRLRRCSETRGKVSCLNHSISTLFGLQRRKKTNSNICASTSDPMHC